MRVTELATIVLVSTALPVARTNAQASADTSMHSVFGTIQSVKGPRMVIQTRTGTLVQVDLNQARADARLPLLLVGRPVVVDGTRDATGVLHARSITRAKYSKALWPPDS